MPSETPSAALDVVVLTEAALSDADVEHILDIYRDPDGDGVPDPVAFRVLVPGEAHRRPLAALIEHLGTGDLRRAWDDLTGHTDPDLPKVSAAAKVEASVAGLRAAGVPADGAVIDDDPLPALRRAVAGGSVREVVVVTYPHAFADTVHADWASRARETLQVPVLHLYAGTSELG